MGIYNRDYLRDSASSGGYGARPPASAGMVRKIVVATVIIYILQIVIPPTSRPVQLQTPDGVVVQVMKSEGPVTRWLKVDFPEIAYRGQVWRLLTYAFCHAPGSLLHIVFNLWLLWLLGHEVEALYGSKEFLWFYCVSAVFAAICYIGLGLAFRDLAPMLGASGAVTAVTMLYTLHYPRRKIYIWGIIGVEMRWLMTIVIVMDLHPILLQAGQGIRSGDVAHAAHLGGALFGWFYFKRQIRLSALVRGVGLGGKSPRKRSRSNLKIFTPPSEPKNSGEVNAAQVDAILAKISEYGEESLSDREREILRQASRQYRNK